MDVQAHLGYTLVRYFSRHTLQFPSQIDDRIAFCSLSKIGSAITFAFASVDSLKIRDFLKITLLSFQIRATQIRR